VVPRLVRLVVLLPQPESTQAVLAVAVLLRRIKLVELL
jgi:hypothetical protein